MNEKGAVLFMIFILHHGRTSRLLPPTNAIVNTTRPEDKFPLEKRPLNMEAPLKHQIGTTKTSKMATNQNETFVRNNVKTLLHPTRQGTALRLNKRNFDNIPTIAMNNLKNNHNGSERVHAVRRLAKRNIDTYKSLRHGDAISLKYMGMREIDNDRSWLSCLGAGSSCKMRSCSGTNNPFRYECQGEVFLIYGLERYPNKKILNCDTVGLLFKIVPGGAHYWLSEDEIFNKYYRTRTCRNEFTVGVMLPCERERFQIRVAGKECGENVEDRDDIRLKGETGLYVVGAYRNAWIWAEQRNYPPVWQLYIH